jgi:hypothetical protein
MRVGLNSVPPEQIRNARTICDIDSEQHKFGEQVYGQERTASAQKPEQSSRDAQMLEVEIVSSNPEHLQSLLRKVESAKGRLPRMVQHLKAHAETA